MATKSDVSMSTCIDSYGSAIGMPQLCTDWASNQIFWLVVTLVAIFFVLSRLALPQEFRQSYLKDKAQLQTI